MSGYTSHGFVIDAPEARNLFKNVRGAIPEELQLCEAPGEECYMAKTGAPNLLYLSTSAHGGAKNGKQREAGDQARADSKPRKGSSDCRHWPFRGEC